MEEALGDFNLQNSRDIDPGEFPSDEEDDRHSLTVLCGKPKAAAMADELKSVSSGMGLSLS